MQSDIIVSSLYLVELFGVDHGEVMAAAHRLSGEGVISMTEVERIMPGHVQVEKSVKIACMGQTDSLTLVSLTWPDRLGELWQFWDDANGTSLDARLNDPAFLRELLAIYADKILALETELAACAQTCADETGSAE